jgi:predicted O-methyltransferase YrrM
MLARLRSASRERLVRVVEQATRTHFAELRTDVVRLEHRLNALDAELKGSLKAWERRNRRDIFTAVDWDAMRSSAAFFRRELARATPHFHKRATLKAALAEAPQTGLYLEFGVAAGATLRQIAEVAPKGCLYGFDCFEGLPEHWRTGFGVGAFQQEQLPDVPGAELVVGLFDDTLPGFLQRTPGEVAFLHLDADLYSSTKTVLDALAPRLREGTVIVFDEYFNFPGWEEHEHRAWTEFVERTGVRFEYLGFTADDEQLSVRLTSAPVVQAAGEQTPGRRETCTVTTERRTDDAAAASRSSRPRGAGAATGVKRRQVEEPQRA